MKLEHFLTPYKINSKLIKDLNVRPETTKLIGKEAEDSMTYIAARVKEITKINKWDIIKNFCTAEETINKMKRQPSE